MGPVAHPERKIWRPLLGGPRRPVMDRGPKGDQWLVTAAPDAANPVHPTYVDAWRMIAPDCTGLPPLKEVGFGELSNPVHLAKCKEWYRAAIAGR